MRQFIYILILSFIFSLKLNAQVFPNLNASTGNEGQYIVDIDTNVYMFHGSQLEKLDKNFNPIWVKKYVGLDIYSLLLSKTGSIYFIAKDSTDYSFMSNAPNLKYVGKINNSGNVVWMNTIEHSSLDNINIRQLLLDRNNNLILSGESGSQTESALLIKLDTIGDMIFFKYFTKPFRFSNVTILNDSSGFYKCVYTDHGFENADVATFLYSEQGDSIFSQSSINEYPQHYYISASNYYKSRKDAAVFYSITEHVYQGSSPGYVTIRKYKNNIILWNKKFSSFYGAYYFINSFDEDENKNVIFTISPKYGPGNNHTGFYSMCFKVDSSGVFDGQYKTLLSYNWWPPSSQQESAKLHVLKNRKYFYDVFAKNFPSNPLSVTYLDSTLTTNCSNATAMTMTNGIVGPISNIQKNLIETDIPPYILNNFGATTSTVTAFSITFNFCLALNNKESVKNKCVEIYPNPTKHTLNINTANFDIIEAIIFDVSGRKVLSTYDHTEIDVSKLSTGLYFIKIKTDQGEFSRKFIKE